MDARSEMIVSLFQASWVEVTTWYNDLVDNYYSHKESYRELQAFIKKLIESGDDRYFRAGTSLSTLMISRSVNFGLRDDQKFVSIDVIGDKVFEIKLRDPLKIYREFRISSLDDPRLQKVLKTLKDTLVD